MATQVLDILKEAYNPKMLVQKIIPVVKIRLLKVVAMVINQRVGQWLCGWDGYENRILDVVGSETFALYHRLYGTRLTQSGVRRFLARRMYYCFISTVATVVQIALTFYGKVVASLFISILLIPITLLDRQWATSVTKMPPRLERSEVIRMRRPIAAFVEQAFPPNACELPRRWLLQLRWRFMVGIEMLVGSLQFLSGTFLFIYSVTAALSPQLSKVKVQGHDIIWILIGLRFFKELINWVSPLLEQFLTPLKYQKNEEWWRDSLRAICQATDGGDHSGVDMLASAPHVARAEFANRWAPFINCSMPVSPTATSGEILQCLPEHCKHYDYTKEEQELLRLLILICLSGGTATGDHHARMTMSGRSASGTASPSGTFGALTPISAGGYGSDDAKERAGEVGVLVDPVGLEEHDTRQLLAS